MLVKTNSQRLKNFNLNFDDNCKFIRNFSAGFGWFEDWIPKIMEVWGSDKIVLVSKEIESDDSTLIGIKDIEVNSEFKNYWYQIFIYSEEEALRMIPAILCPNFTYNYHQLLKSRFNQRNLYCGFFANSILLSKKDGVIKYKTIASQMYKIDKLNKRYKKYENTCKIKNCCWKPTRVWDINTDNLEDVFLEIERGLISTNASEFIFDDIKISNSGLHPDEADIKALWKLMSLFEINKKSIINIKGISINYQKKFEKQNKLKINAKDLLFVFEKKSYKIQSKKFKITWIGLVYISNDNDTVIIQWNEFTSAGILITLEDDNPLFKPDWYEKFPEKYSSNGLDLYLVVKKSDIIEFTNSQLRDFTNIWTLPNLQKVGITITDNDYENKELVNILESTPKAINLKIYLKRNTRYSDNDKFWTIFYKLKKIKFQHDVRWSIKVDHKSKKLKKKTYSKVKQRRL